MIHDLKFVWYKINYFYLVARSLMMVCFTSCTGRLLSPSFGAICCFRISMLGWIKDMVGCLLSHIRVVSVFIGFKTRINYSAALRSSSDNVTTSFKLDFFYILRQKSCKHCRLLLNISTKHIIGTVPTSWYILNQFVFWKFKQHLFWCHNSCSCGNSVKKRNYPSNSTCNFINHLIATCVARFNVCAKHLMWGRKFWWNVPYSRDNVTSIICSNGNWLRFLETPLFNSISFVKTSAKFSAVWEEFNCLVCKVWFWISKLSLI